MTKILKGKKAISEAAELLRKGEVVAFPTETVYGLGADAFNDEAVEKIFEVKGRPNDNPLIVHVCSKEQAKEIGYVNKNADRAMELWPGPLTIVLKKKKKVSGKITCGLETVAIRMPKNKIALELIEKVGPLVAPSANLSGKPSATRAEHVLMDFNEKIPLIIDGGKCRIGLESSVIDLSTGAEILRPGFFGKEKLERIFPGIKDGKLKGKPKSPGMKYKHYSPKAEVILAGGTKIGEVVREFKEKKVEVICSVKRKRKGKKFSSKKELGENLYSWLREFDDKGCEVIVVEMVSESGLGGAIMNRLRKAASRVIE